MELIGTTARLKGRGAVMFTILGLLLFFGLTGLILWHFNEAVWRVEDDEDRDSLATREEEPMYQKHCADLCSSFDNPVQSE
jgi:hypothetical protein